MVGRQSADYSGALSLNAHVTGTVGNPSGTTDLQVENGTIQSEQFDRIQARVNMADQLIAVPSAYITSGVSRVDLSAEYQHPRESLSAGRVHAHVQSNHADLAQFRNVQKQWPNTSGKLQLQADVVANVTQSDFQVTAVTADMSAHNLRFEAENYGDFNATARTNGQRVNYNVVSDFAGSNIRVNGSTELVRGYPTRADANLNRLPIPRMLALAKRRDIPARGNLSGTARFSGTLDKPEGSADLEIVNAVLYDEPIDSLRVRATYLAQSIDLPELQIASGPSRIDMTARYTHPPGNLQAGNLQLQVNSNRIDLARIRNLQKIRPALGGKLQIAASGAASVQEGNQRVTFSNLNANVSATGISDNRRSFGDLTLAANTTGQRLSFTLNSNLANAVINGQGDTQLSGDYPLTADLTFNSVAWTQIQALLSPGVTPSFEAVTDGQLTVSGPAMKTAELNGALQLTRFQVNTVPVTGTGKKQKPVVIQNQGPISVTVQGGEARIASFHLIGPETDLQANGTASFQNQTMNVSLKANTNLGLLRSFDEDVNSSGTIALSAILRGTTAKPLVNGQLELHNASLNHVSLPNGISNANGVVTFNGNSASVRNLTAESGGGTITIGGFASFAERLRFGLRANAAKVRVRLQQGVSVVTGADVRLTGAGEASVLSGTITLEQVTYAPQSDFGSMLTRAAPPVQSSGPPSPMLNNMKMDIQVRTSSSLAVQASLAQNLQVDADLRIRGTASQPSVLGRVLITEGQLVFFGSA